MAPPHLDPVDEAARSHKRAGTAEFLLDKGANNNDDRWVDTRMIGGGPVGTKEERDEAERERLLHSQEYDHFEGSSAANFADRARVHYDPKRSGVPQRLKISCQGS